MPGHNKLNYTLTRESKHWHQHINIFKRNSGDIILLEPNHGIQVLNMMSVKCLVQINKRKSVHLTLRDKPYRISSQNSLN